MLLTPNANKDIIPRKSLRLVKRYFFKKLKIKMRHNTEHKSDAIFEIICYCVFRNASPEGATAQLRMLLPDASAPSADAVLRRIKSLSRQQVQHIFMKALRQMCKRARHLFTKPAVLAIDLHDIPYYGDRNNVWVVGTKKKAGTHYAFRYATIDVVEEGRRFTLGVIPMKCTDEMHEAVKQLISCAMKYVRIRLVLLDRGFFNVKCINALKEMRMRYLMPAVKNKKIAALIDEGKFERPLSIDYVMGDDEKAEFTLLLLDDEKKECISFATNLRLDAEKCNSVIPEEYRARWGIETGYRVKKDFRPFTTSRSAVVRQLFFFLSVLFYNLWVLVNALADKHIDTDTLRLMFFLECIEYIPRGIG